MHLNLSQQMKMSQQMKLAPRMIQSMEILQLNLMSLQEKVDEALQENPVLEIIDRDNALPDLVPADPGQEEMFANKEIEQRELVVDSDHSNEADFERLLEMSAEIPDDNYSEGSRPSSNRMEDDMNRQHDQVSSITTRPQSLHDYLLDQYHFFEVPVELRDFGEFLIQNLDRNGRLQGTLPEIMQVYGRPLTMDQALQSLSLIQKLDPPGVGARDLAECLLLQVDDNIYPKDVVITLISQHLDDIAQNRLPLIEKKTGYSIEVIKDAIDTIKTLNPLIGREFESVRAQNVTPDVYVELDDHGKYVVRLENERLPQLRISRKYLKLLKENPDAKTREYIKRKVEAAKWLIDSISQRQNTLKRVAQAIVDHQTEFLIQGEDHIVPLKMQQIADVVSVHVTTISRAVDDKWIQTPRGLFALKRFFGGGTVDANGEEVAWDIIRLKLKEIVDAESKGDPLSDDALVDELAKQGYNLARRTVTKYRKALNIPSSRQRRVY
jgi:RNA polymerase sigma-54 factor